MAELIEEVPGGLERYRPQLRYCLVDEGRIAAADLEPLRNVAAALFRLEKSRGPEEIERVLAALIEWLHVPEMSELRRAFVVWLRAPLWSVNWRSASGLCRRTRGSASIRSITRGKPSATSGSVRAPLLL